MINNRQLRVHFIFRCPLVLNLCRENAAPGTRIHKGSVDLHSGAYSVAYHITSEFGKTKEISI